MSSTRKAQDDSVFHQSRFASSPDIARGLQAYLVALRCTALDSAADRELIWFLQYLSHREGGMAAVAKDLIAKFPNRFQTSEMIGLKVSPSKMLNAEQVLGIRRRLPLEVRAQFPIKADFDLENFSEDGSCRDLPAGYAMSNFLFHCRLAAASNLETDLMEFCLNAGGGFSSPWYFSEMPEVLREYKANFIKSKSIGNFTTALGKKVFEVLDYTAYCRGLTLIQGETRLGKSHAGKAWCEQHPGKARFIEVPSGNDEVTFFRDLARGLGLGNFLNYKVVQIRERVESVLRTGDIILVLDEAQRLWPQTNFREGYPKRIAWVMTMANAGVPICMISTPQFLVTQKVVEKNGWNSAQLTGRISHYESLPQNLTQDDLIGVAKAVLPEADKEVLRALAVYAQSSARYLAAIDSIAKRARYIAKCEGRDVATAGDVRRAMKESVVPADTKLLFALESGAGAKLPKIKPSPVPEPASPRDVASLDHESHNRLMASENLTGSRRKVGDLGSVLA